MCHEPRVAWIAASACSQVLVGGEATARLLPCEVRMCQHRISGAVGYYFRHGSGTTPFADDLALSRGAVPSRAVSLLRSTEAHPSDLRCVQRTGACSWLFEAAAA